MEQTDELIKHLLNSRLYSEVNLICTCSFTASKYREKSLAKMRMCFERLGYPSAYSDNRTKNQYFQKVDQTQHYPSSLKVLVGDICEPNSSGYGV